MHPLRLAPILVILTALFSARATAQEKKSVAEKHDTKALVDSLRDVINTGADLFNLQGDYAGCYRLYQGALISIKPFLNPELQAKIDQAIAKAERMTRASDRAFELRAVVDEIRAQGRGTSAAPKTEKTAEPKKAVEKKVEVAKKEVGKEKTAAVANGTQLSGVITYNGKPAPPGFITLVGTDQRRFSASLTEGKYQFKTPIPPGTYKIAVERVPGAKIGANVDIPERYRSENTSGLTAEIKGAKMTFDLDLVR